MGNASEDRQRYDRQNSAYLWSVDPKSDGQTETVNLKADTECAACSESGGGTFSVVLGYAIRKLDTRSGIKRCPQPTSAKRYEGSITSNKTKGKRLTNYHCALCGAFAIRLHRLACKLSIQRTLPICNCPYTWNSRFGS